MDFSKDLTFLFERTEELKQGAAANDASSKVIANVFYEPSTRTSMSFEAAMYKLGGNVIQFHKDLSSEKKGECFEDTIRTIASYVDAIVLRHPDPTAVHLARIHSSVPVIDAGSGGGRHPTQAVLDMFTIRQYHANPRTVLVIGDARRSRTVKSLVEMAVQYFTGTQWLFCPYPGQEPTAAFIERANGGRVVSVNDLDTILPTVDVVYATRLQRERTLCGANDTQCDKVPKEYVITAQFMAKLASTAIVMHPLPRNEEIDPSVDSDPRCVFFEQTRNGLFTRMAILEKILF